MFCSYIGINLFLLVNICVSISASVLKMYNALIQKTYFFIMKISNFHCDLTDIPPEKETLVSIGIKTYIFPFKNVMPAVTYDNTYCDEVDVILVRV